MIPAGDLHQQRVIVGGDNGTHVGIAAVQTDTESAGGGVGRDLAVVRGKVVGGVLGGHTALDGVAVDVDILLPAQADLRVTQGIPCGNEDLTADDIHAGDHLRHRMLHLNAGVHLDEVVAAVFIHQKLHRTGADVPHRAGNFHGIPAQRLHRLLRDGPCRGKLHHLLIPPLEGAVPLAQMIDVAVLIRQNLHLDVLGLHQILLHEDIAAAEGLLRLAVDQLIGGADLLRAVAAAHATTAAAGRRLQNHREAEGHRLLHSVLCVPQRLRAAGDDGNAAGDSDLLGAELVAHLPQHLGGWPDEQDTVFLTGSGKVGILRQEAVAGMDGGNTTALGQSDDAGNIQIRPQRGFFLPHQIRLVRLGTEQRIGVLIGVDGHRVDAQIVAGTENADGNFATVGHQHLLDFFGLHDPSPLSVSWTFVCTYYTIDLPRLAEGKQHKSSFCSLSQGRRGFSPQIWKLFPLPPAVGIKKPYQKLPPALSRYPPAPFFRRNVRNESYRRVGFLHKRSPSPHLPKALKRHQRRIPNRDAALMVNKGRRKE